MFHLFDWTQFKRFCRVRYHSFICYLGLWQEHIAVLGQVSAEVIYCFHPFTKCFVRVMKKIFKKNFIWEDFSNNFWLKIAGIALENWTISFYIQFNRRTRVWRSSRAWKTRTKNLKNEPSTLIIDPWHLDQKSNWFFRARWCTTKCDRTKHQFNQHKSNGNGLFIAADFEMSLSLNISNFIIVYQSQTVHRKLLVDVTPVQPAFQYRGKKCKLSGGMVSLLVTI